MKPIKEVLRSPLITKITGTGDDGAMFEFKYKARKYEVIASNGGGWDHVSIVPVNQKRIPTWEVMCVLKDMCFNEDEVVMELHPAKKDYVNVHNECLHLWKPQEKTIPTPPKLFV